eukprot:11673216-Ditylum_brightwellii.AAC.1
MAVKSVEDIHDPVLTSIDWDHFICTLGADCHFGAEEAHLVPPVHPDWNYPRAALPSPSSPDTSQDQR